MPLRSLGEAGAPSWRLRRHRMKFKKIILTIFIIFACYGTVWAGKYLLPKYLPAKVEAKYRARSLGNPKAKTWIIEYADFQCANCREAFKFMEGHLGDHPEEAYLQFRYYPLIHSHLYALKSAIYADCAARQGKFWETARKIFEAQEEWGAAKDPDAILARLGQEAGLDTRVLGACLEDSEIKSGILKEREEGKALGIKMTPTFFVNGKKIEGFEAMRVEVKNEKK